MIALNHLSTTGSSLSFKSLLCLYIIRALTVPATLYCTNLQLSNLNSIFVHTVTLLPQHLSYLTYHPFPPFNTFHCRLSYYDHVEEIVPVSFRPLLPPQPEDSFKFEPKAGGTHVQCSLGRRDTIHIAVCLSVCVLVAAVFVAADTWCVLYVSVHSAPVYHRHCPLSSLSRLTPHPLFTLLFPLSFPTTTPLSPLIAVLCTYSLFSLSCSFTTHCNSSPISLPLLSPSSLPLPPSHPLSSPPIASIPGATVAVKLLDAISGRKTPAEVILILDELKQHFPDSPQEGSHLCG